jgi:hypothetical protein
MEGIDMDQLRDLGDQRQQGFCVHCGGSTETRDHAPSRILLDKPYPTNLPVLPACPTCNEGFSSDEDYLACFIECVLHGSTDPNKLSREKVIRKLAESQALRERIERSKKKSQALGGGEIIVWQPEEDRVQNVILKLARCHASFELNEPQLHDPDHYMVTPLENLSGEQRDHFETAPDTGVWPEVGSRAMQRMIVVGEQPYSDGWLEVQEGRYRYMAVGAGSVMVRGVLSEYLAFEVIWGT